MQPRRAHSDRPALESLQPAQEQLRQLFDLSLDMFCIAGMDGYFKFLNPAWEPTLGYTIRELLERPYVELVHPDDRASTTAAAAQLSSGGQIVSFENRYLCRDGSHKWLLWSATPAPDGKSIYAVARDITERKRVERRLAVGFAITSVLASAPSIATATPQILRAVCEKLDWPIGVIWRVDAEENVLRCADICHVSAATFPRFESLTRAQTFARGAGLAGRVWASREPHAIPDVSADTNFPRAQAAAHDGLRSAFAFPILCGNEVSGVLEFFSTEVRYLTDAILQFFHSLGSQIGQFIERRRAEDDLKEYAGYLEAARQTQEENAARLSVLVKELDTARHRAEEATHAKSDFLASMSHDIRTPMNSILGITELAMQSPLAFEQLEYFRTVHDSASSLLRLIDDILDFSRGEAHKVELDEIEFPLRDLVEESLAVLALRAQQKGLELAGRVSPRVPEILVGDPGRLRRIIVNLIANAIKFTERGEIILAVETESQTAREAVIHVSVRDTGIGIPAEKCEKIFRPFAQADASTSRKYGGTGLGLAICAQLTELMAGRIWVESEEGRGSTFHFTARLALPAGETASAAPAPREFQGQRALIVDDKAASRGILGEILGTWSMSYESAESADDALAALENSSSASNPFRLALIDARMPGVSGVELAQRMHRIPRLASLPLVLLTSAAPLGRYTSDVNGESEKPAEPPFAASISKPVKLSELRGAIFTALGLTPPTSSVAALPSKISKADQPLHLLLADDDPVNQELVSEFLHRRGHRVTVTSSGREALAALQRQPFDAVLMDVQMPGLDGLETTRLIRQNERTSSSSARIPIIAMTGSATDGDRSDCFAAGMDVCVAKPIRFAALFSVLESAARTSAGVASVTGAAGRDVVHPPTAPLSSLAAPIDGKATTVTPVSSASDANAFDSAALLRGSGGDAKLLARLIRIFLADAPRRLRTLRRALAAADLHAIAEAAHALKGSAANFGPNIVSAEASSLELFARENNLASARAAFAELDEEVARFTTALRSLLAGKTARRARKRPPRRGSRANKSGRRTAPRKMPRRLKK